MGPNERRGEELRAQVSAPLETLRAMRSRASDDDEGLGLESGPPPSVLAMRVREHADGEGGGVDLNATLDLFEAFINYIDSRMLELHLTHTAETCVIQKKALNDRLDELKKAAIWVRVKARLAGIPMECKL